MNGMATFSILYHSWIISTDLTEKLVCAYSCVSYPDLRPMLLHLRLGHVAQLQFVDRKDVRLQNGPIGEPVFAVYGLQSQLSRNYRNENFRRLDG